MPKGPEFLVMVTRDHDSVFQRVRSTTGGGTIDRAMNEVLESPRRMEWLSNPAIDHFVAYLFRREGGSTYYVEKLLKAPELRSHPKYLIWEKAVSIKDSKKRMKFLDRERLHN